MTNPTTSHPADIIAAAIRRTYGNQEDLARAGAGTLGELAITALEAAGYRVRCPECHRGHGHKLSCSTGRDAK